MNSLQLWLQQTGYSKVKVMNFLQDHGLISDNCIGPEDLAWTDADRVVYKCLTRYSQWSAEQEAAKQLTLL